LGLITESLHVFNRHSGKYPAFYFLYRTGVSIRERIENKEGRKDFIEFEDDKIKRIVAHLMNIKLCYILVDKKTNIKFFQNVSNEYSNPKAGTVVESGITTPNAREFYLQSHMLIKAQQLLHTIKYFMMVLE
jgi:hypothetical protein